MGFNLYRLVFWRLVCSAFLVWGVRGDVLKQNLDSMSPFLHNNGSCLVYNHRYPPHCDPSANCQFLVSWRELPFVAVAGGGGVVSGVDQLQRQNSLTTECRQVEFRVIAFGTSDLSSMDDSIWLALGLSVDREMAGVDVATCWYSQSNYSINTGNNKLSRGGHQLKSCSNDQSAGVQLLDASYQTSNNSFQCRFIWSLNTSGEVSLEGKDRFYVWLGLGTARPENTSEEDASVVTVLKDQVMAVSDCSCSVGSCDEECTCPPSLFSIRLLKLHGVVMSLTFLFLFPLGSVLSRYYKVVFLQTWFKMHVTVVILGVFWSLVGLLMVLWHTKLTFEPGIHQIVGVVLLLLVVVQPTMGCFRPSKGVHIRRKVFVLSHRLVATLILYGSALTIFLGLWLYRSRTMVFAMATLGLYLVLNVAFVVSLEVLKKWNKFTGEAPVVYRKVMKTEQLSESEDEVFMKEDFYNHQPAAYRFEKAVLLVFTTGNLMLASVLAALVYYFNPDD